MATERARPYSAFNYLVALGTGEDTTQPKAGFQEVTGLGMEHHCAGVPARQLCT